jgi:hypothetical protein
MLWANNLCLPSKTYHTYTRSICFVPMKRQMDNGSKKHKIVKGIFTRAESLCSVLKRHIKQTDIDLTTISIVFASSVNDLNQLDQSFMYSQILKEILLTMKHDENAKKDEVERDYD